MSTAVWVVVAVLIVALAAGAGFMLKTRSRSQRLQRQFGPEYDRALERHGNRGAAEKELLERRNRHAELDIRPLDPHQRELYREQWTHVQERFVDTPEAAVEQADRLVVTVMGERGYPTKDFEDRIAHLSVEHGRTLDQYRRGHDISRRAAGNEASTEDLRQAMVHYRALFEELLAVPEGEATVRRSEAHTETRADNHESHAEARAEEREQEHADQQQDRRAAEAVRSDQRDGRN
jgi:hypothetical protein